MRKYAIVIGGLESGYMRKLALCLQDRFDSRVQVEVVENNREAVREEKHASAVWVGSESFVNEMTGSDTAANRIILDDEEQEDEIHIFRFRPAERLYREIWRRCRRMGCYPAAGIKNRRQKWYVVTTDGSMGVLLAFSMTCAQILGGREEVLYVNLSECCGMRQLFRLEEEPDLSDLILELRKQEETLPEMFAGRIGQADYLLPPDNPMILHEIGREDMERFVRALHRSEKYDSVVFAVGTTVCGCEQIFAAADRLFHLTGQGEVHTCAREAWLELIRLCTEKEAPVRQIPEPEVAAESRGGQLLEDWLDEPVGRLAGNCLREREDDDDTVAGD